MNAPETSATQPTHGISGLVQAQVESLAGEYQLQLENWTFSENSQLLENLLTQELHGLSHLRITRCICFGLGRFTPSEPRWQGDSAENRIAQCRVVMEQLVLLTMVLDALRKVHPIHEVFFQDPLFTEVDSLFLESLGFSVLQSPDALRELDPATFVFAPYPPNVVVADVFRTCNPALYIGADLSIVQGGDMDEGALSEAARARRLEVFGPVSSYEQSALMKVMPLFDGYHWSRGLCLYWLA